MRKNCLEYPVEVTDDLFAEGNAVLESVLKTVTGVDNPRVLLVADHNIVRHTPSLGTKLGTWFKRHGVTLANQPVILSGGERAKLEWATNLAVLQKVIHGANLESTDPIVVIGGGSVLDVAGFAVAQMRCGAGIVRIPSSPPAMLDGAFSEMAAVDSPDEKDSFAISCKPLAVVIDPTMGRTVLDGVWFAGFSAVLRMALVQDAAFAKHILSQSMAFRSRSVDVLRDTIAGVVDLRRKKGGTDFALWSTHRLEVMSEYKLPFGYAVALGIALDVAYAAERGLMSRDDAMAVRTALDESGVMSMALNSRPLLANSDSLLQGLDDWRRKHRGAREIVLPKGIGKSAEVIPDRGAMKCAAEMIK